MPHPLRLEPLETRALPGSIMAMTADPFALAPTDRGTHLHPALATAAGGVTAQRMQGLLTVSYDFRQGAQGWTSGFADWDFWVAAAARGVRGHHLPRPLLQHRRRRDSHLVSIIGDYERLFANLILNNQAVYSDSEVTAARRFLSSGEPSALLRLSRLIFAQTYPMPAARSA